MTVEISGLSDLLNDLESRLGPAAFERISDQALKDASLVFKAELVDQLSTFKDTGATLDELTFSEPYTKDGVRTITVYWKGPKRRYAVAHLNEFGTVKNPNPRGKGAVARSIQASAAAYKQAVEESIRGAI